MRREDREVKDINAITEILKRCDVLRLGLNDAMVPYIVPVCFGFRQENETLKLFFHSANEGKKVGLITKTDTVSFEADCSFKVLPGEKACGFSACYESVIGYGNIRLLCEKCEKIEAFNAVMSKYSSGDSFTYNETSINKTNLYEITVTEICGKRNI